MNRPAPEEFEREGAWSARGVCRLGGVAVKVRSEIPLEGLFSQRNSRFVSFQAEGFSQNAARTSRGSALGSAPLEDSAHGGLSLDIFRESRRPWFINPAEAVHYPDAMIREPGTEKESFALFYYLAARLDWHRRRARALMVEGAPRAALERTMESFLKEWVSEASPPLGTCFLHGAALVPAHGASKVGKRAVVLLGPSDAGKSTASHIACWSGKFRVLSDELITLWKDGERWKVGGAPFGGTLSAAGEADLRGIFRLRQSPDARVEPLAPSAALGELVAATQHGNFRGAANADPALSLLSLAVSEVPCYSLHFSPAEKFLNLLEGILQK